MHDGVKPTLVVDAGSTKTSWAVVGSQVRSFEGQGINALWPDEKISAAFAHASMTLGKDVGLITYFGAGCASPQICSKIRRMLADAFDADRIEVDTDLLGAAKALCGDNPGVVAILGTGSNSGLYDGRVITANTPPLGFILGDEGSAAALGKRILSDVLKGVAPTDITDALAAETDLSMHNVLEAVYKNENPRPYLATFCDFLKRNITHAYIKHLVEDEFDRFFTRNIDRYYAQLGSRIGFIGSVAFFFREQLETVAKCHGFNDIVIERRPIDKLIEYYA